MDDLDILAELFQDQLDTVDLEVDELYKEDQHGDDVKPQDQLWLMQMNLQRRSAKKNMVKDKLEIVVKLRKAQLDILSSLA